jgi:hypothetical protein
VVYFNPVNRGIVEALRQLNNLAGAINGDGYLAWKVGNFTSNAFKCALKNKSSPYTVEQHIACIGMLLLSLWALLRLLKCNGNTNVMMDIISR